MQGGRSRKSRKKVSEILSNRVGSITEGAISPRSLNGPTKKGRPIKETYDRREQGGCGITSRELQDISERTGCLPNWGKEDEVVTR